MEYLEKDIDTLEKELENAEKKLDSKSKVLKGIKTGVSIGGILGVTSYLINQDPEATTTLMDTISLIAEPVKTWTILGYLGGKIYSTFSKYKE